MRYEMGNEANPVDLDCFSSFFFPPFAEKKRKETDRRSLFGIHEDFVEELE